MTANLVPIGQFQQLKAQLEDTQESLGAALARIEVFRLREKILAAEIAKLRLGEPVGTEAAVLAAADATAATEVQGQPTAAGHLSSQPLDPATAEQHETEQHSKWPIPCYVTEIGDNLPVMLFGGAGRKVRNMTGPSSCVSACKVYAQVNLSWMSGPTAVSPALSAATDAGTFSSGCGQHCCCTV